MADPWMPLALLHASLVTLAPMSFGLGWASMVFGSAAGPRPHPDLLALGLDRMPPSWDDLRRAYRSAARKAHPGMSLAAARRRSWPSRGHSSGCPGSWAGGRRNLVGPVAV